MLRSFVHRVCFTALVFMFLFPLGLVISSDPVFALSSNTQSLSSNLFVEIAKKQNPAVVNVSTKAKTETVHKNFRPPSPSPSPRPGPGQDRSPDPFRDFYDRFFGERPNQPRPKQGMGSGFVIDKEGHILTNYHVIEEIDRVLVKLSNGREYFAKILGHDSHTDLAVLKISTLRSLPEAKFGHSQGLQVGEWVMAIGNPYGLEGTVTVGIISGKGRTDLGMTRFESYIQTDASINPGNSGGPLISLDGNIIGINTGVAAIGSGVGFAIPVETALKIANQLVESGSVARGWMGIGIQNLTPELAQTLEFRNGDGVLVNSVDSKTPAHKGGIRRGDIILQFDGKPVPDSKLLQKMVADTNIGRDVLVKIFREGQERALKVKIGKLVS